MPLIELGVRVLERESEMLHQLGKELDGSFEKAAYLLAECKGHIVTSGVGTTGIVARRFAHLLCNVGCPALFLHAGDSLHGSSGAVRREDVLVLFSKTGETQETCALASLVKDRQTPILTFTARPDSTIGRMSHLIVRVDTPPDVDPYDGLMGSGSTTALDAICDALLFAILEIKGVTREQFIHGHPGGIIRSLTSEDRGRNK
jgi:arabinose-5-phosphate isomerase